MPKKQPSAYELANHIIERAGVDSKTASESVRFDLVMMHILKGAPKTPRKVEKVQQ